MKKFFSEFILLAAFAVLIGCGQKATDEKPNLDAESMLTGWLSAAKEQDQRILIHVGAPG